MSRESLFDLISLFCRRLGRQTAEATSRLGSTPHLGLRFPAPPTHTHTASTPRGAERKTEGNGGEAAKVQSPGSANRPVQLCPLSGPPSPPAHTNTEAEAGSGRGRLSPAPPHTPPVPKSHARKKATRLGACRGPVPLGRS